MSTCLVGAVAWRWPAPLPRPMRAGRPLLSDCPRSLGRLTNVRRPGRCALGKLALRAQLFLDKPILFLKGLRGALFLGVSFDARQPAHPPVATNVALRRIP